MDGRARPDIQAFGYRKGGWRDWKRMYLLAETVELMNKARAEQSWRSSEEVGKLLRALIRAFQEKS